jgi:hypothetical protein
VALCCGMLGMSVKELEVLSLEMGSVTVIGKVDRICGVGTCGSRFWDVSGEYEGNGGTE